MAYKIKLEIMAEDKEAILYFLKQNKANFLDWIRSKKEDRANSYTDSDNIGSSELNIEEVIEC
jgi:hypothetical protein